MRKLLAVVAVLPILFIAPGCDTDQVQDTDPTGEYNIGATWADLPANLNCVEAGQNGTLMMQVRNVTENGDWENMDDNQGAEGELLNYNCSGPSQSSARWEGNVWGLKPDIIYAYRLFGWDSVVARERGGNGFWSEDSDPNNGGDGGAYNRFTTYSEVKEIDLADIGEDNGTDAQAAVNARRAHLTLSWRRGKGDRKPKVSSLAWVKQQDAATCNPECNFQDWAIDFECRHAMRVWSPRDGMWIRMFTNPHVFEEAPARTCRPSSLEGKTEDEESSGAAARVTFELIPKTKRWRNLRPGSNCKRWEDENGFDHLECTAFLGQTPPAIG